MRVVGSGGSGGAEAAADGSGSGSGADSGSGGGELSEAEATRRPDAAGTDTMLPATGSGSLLPTLVGLALLGAGVALRRRIRPAS